MNALHRIGLLSTLTLCLAAGCKDDGDEPETPAAAGAGGDSGAAGTPGEAGGAGGVIAGGAAGETVAGAAGGEAVAGGADAGGAAGGGGEGGAPDPFATSTVVDVNDVKTSPEPYDWFDFRPNVKKLILAGAAETEHIAILWYTVADGGVGLHYHAKTESVYVIDGSQTDGKGSYTNGTVYFNPPGSGHQVTDSGGFFLLAYAAPPDFVNTSLIEEYTPVTIDTTDPSLTTTYAFTEQGEGIQTYTVPLDADGGLSSQLIETTAPTPYAYEGNYLLVLAGSCEIQGVTMAAGMLVVSKTIEPQSYEVAATTDSCLALAVSF